MGMMHRRGEEIITRDIDAAALLGRAFRGEKSPRQGGVAARSRPFFQHHYGAVLFRGGDSGG